MNRNVIFGAAAVLGLALMTSAASAAIFSPNQTQLNGVVFADFIDNAAPDFASLNSKTLFGGDAVTYNFTTDYDINDNLNRVALENTDFTLDLTPYDAFRISFSNPVVPTGTNLRAQIFVRSAGDSVFAGSTSLAVVAGNTVTASISKQRIIDLGGDPTQLSSFGIEFFGGDEFLGTTFTARASTSPQPPNLVDTLVSSFETADNPATPSVNEAFENWTTLQGPYVNATVPHPDHTHTISTIGATNGAKSLRIDRLVTGAGLPDSPATTTFRWGSRMLLDANAGGGQPVGDYNGDNAVNALDYTRWRNNLGAARSTILNPDSANGMGPVSELDFTSWKTRYGNTGGGTNPTVLAQVQNLVALINNPDSYSVSFDLRFEDQIPTANPGYAILDFAIQAAQGAGNVWWQTTQQYDIDLSPLENGNPVIATVDFLLSQFDDVGQNGIQSLKTVGLDPNTQYIAFNLSTNFPTDGAPKTYKLYIDNVRIRRIAHPGSGGGTIPEPSALMLALLAMAGGAGARRRRNGA